MRIPRAITNNAVLMGMVWTALPAQGAQMTCQPASQAVQAGGLVTVKVFVQDVADLRGYQTTIGVTRTSGSGTVSVPCPGGVVIDTNDPDHVFQGKGGLPAYDCAHQRAAMALFSDQVSVGSTPAYLVTYTLAVSADAATNSTFSIAILPEPSSFLRDSGGNPIPFTVGPPCMLTVSAGLPQAPTGAQAVPSAVCPGGASTLSAAPGSGGDLIEWFTGSCGGTLTGTGPSLEVHPMTTTTYHARTKNSGTSAVSTCVAVTVTVHTWCFEPPTDCHASASIICAGQSTTLSAVCSGGCTIEWFTGGCGDALIGTGASIAVSPSTTTTYYVRCKNPVTGCAGPCGQVTVNVNEGLSAPTGVKASPQIITPGGSSSLSATPGTGGNTVEWFTGSCGGTLVGAGTSITVAPAQTTTYYARTKGTTPDCVSVTCTAVTVAVTYGPLLTCQTDCPTVQAGRTATLKLFVQNASDLRGYQTAIGITRMSGSGSVTVACPGGVTINTDAADYIFHGKPGFPAYDCENRRAAMALLSDDVNVGVTPAYLATYTLAVSPDAVPESTFSIAILPEPNSLLRDSGSNPIPFAIGSPCTIKVGWPGDTDHDGDADLADFLKFQACFNGPNRPAKQAECEGADLDADTDVDLADFLEFQGCFNGPNRPPKRY